MTKRIPEETVAERGGRTPRVARRHRRWLRSTRSKTRDEAKRSRGACGAGVETSRGKEGLVIVRRRLHAIAQADRRAAEQRPGRPGALIINYEF